MGAFLKHLIRFQRLLEVPLKEVHEDKEGSGPRIQFLVVQLPEQGHGGVDGRKGFFEARGFGEKYGVSVRELEEGERALVARGGGVFRGLLHLDRRLGHVFREIESGVVRGKGVGGEGPRFQIVQFPFLPLPELVEEQLQIPGAPGGIHPVAQQAHAAGADFAGRFRHARLAGRDRFAERKPGIRKEQAGALFPQSFPSVRGQTPDVFLLDDEPVVLKSVKGDFHLDGGAFQHLDEDKA